MPARAVLVDLLMATMDSMSAWSAAAGDRERGLAWRDAVTQRMIAAGRYVPYLDLVAGTAKELSLRPDAPTRLLRAWRRMRPWPDSAAVASWPVPCAFVTNCSAELAVEAADRSGLRPAFTLSAEEAGWYKPRPEIYLLACERIGAAAAEVAFVAGAPYDADGAAAAGLRSVLVLRRPSAPVPGGIAVVPSMEDAPAAAVRPVEEE